MSAAKRVWIDPRMDVVLRAVQVAVSVIAVVALIIAIIGLEGVTNSRRQSARDSCNLLIGLVQAATPASKTADANAFIRRTPLANCNTYARKIVQ